ncbi:hypothetical protein NSS79_05095 [Paenibacillus sp. FSL L8-0436]|uniref:hypothetical protein n=1 Tax=Paenibacillus sp. FSL L8-0436 TaxID=2954686 RepID=UPI0031585155
MNAEMSWHEQFIKKQSQEKKQEQPQPQPQPLQLSQPQDPACPLYAVHRDGRYVYLSGDIYLPGFSPARRKARGIPIAERSMAAPLQL